MIGCLRARVRKQPIIALYFESDNKLKFITTRPGCLTLIAFLLSCGCECWLVCSAWLWHFRSFSLFLCSMFATIVFVLLKIWLPFYLCNKCPISPCSPKYIREHRWSCINVLLNYTQKKKFSQYLCFLIKSTIPDVSLSNFIHELYYRSFTCICLLCDK